MARRSTNSLKDPVVPSETNSFDAGRSWDKDAQKCARRFSFDPVVFWWLCVLYQEGLRVEVISKVTVTALSDGCSESGPWWGMIEHVNGGCEPSYYGAIMGVVRNMQ